MNTEKCVDYQRERGMGEIEDAWGEINGVERRLDLG